MTWQAIAGECYFILVQNQQSFPRGQFGLSVDEFEAPPNDQCLGAISIATDGSEVISSTVDATVDSNLTSLCGTSITAPSLWYSVEVENAARLIASTCSFNTDFDTKLSVFSGSCGSLRCIAGNDDHSCALFSDLNSEVEWDATPGET